MFENFIDAQILDLSRKTAAAKRFVTLNDILMNQDIHSFYKTYFNAEVEWWIYEEQIRRQTNINFDFESLEIKPLLDKLDEQMFDFARFDKPGLKTIIDSAVKIRLNFLLRPRTTMKWFVFRGEPTKPFHEILKRLNYFADYEYLLSGFIKYINENHFVRNFDDIFSVIEFERIIEIVDNDYIFALSPDDFIKLIEPFHEFFNPNSEISNNSNIPIEALIIFLDDKGVEPLVRILKDMLVNENLSFINNESFLNLIYSLLNEHDFEQSPQPFSQPVLSQTHFDNISKEPGEDENISELNQKIKGIEEISGLLDSTFSFIHSVNKEMDDENIPEKYDFEEIKETKEFDDYDDGDVIANYSDLNEEILSEKK